MGFKKEYTTDDFLLYAKQVIQQLRIDNRRLVEATDEREVIWAKIGIDKGTAELKVLATKVREQANEEDV